MGSVGENKGLPRRPFLSVRLGVWGASALLILLVLCLGTELVAAAAATQKKDDHHNPPPAPHPYYPPPPPPPAPSFPKSPIIVLPAPTASPAVAPVTRPSTVFVPPQYKPPPLPQRKQLVLRQVEYFAKRKKQQLLMVVFNPAHTVEPGHINDQMIAFTSMLREVRNELQVAKYEHEVDLLAIETNRVLHESREILFKKKVLTKQEYEASRTRLLKSQAKADESKARWEEFIAEEAMLELRIKQTQKQPVLLSEVAQSYVAIWKARLDKAKAAKMQAAFELDFDVFGLDLVKKLYEKKAASRDELIQAQKEADDAGVVLKLTEKLVELNTKNYEESQDAVEQALTQEAEAASAPKPAT